MAPLRYFNHTPHPFKFDFQRLFRPAEWSQVIPSPKYPDFGRGTPLSTRWSMLYNMMFYFAWALDNLLLTV